MPRDQLRSSLTLSTPQLIEENPGRYDELAYSTHIPEQDIRDTILRDINRTFPRHAMFSEVGKGQDSLRRVLCAYSLYDEEVGYCQGLGFITAMFLTYMPEEEVRSGKSDARSETIDEALRIYDLQRRLTSFVAFSSLTLTPRRHSGSLWASCRTARVA